MNYTLAEKHLKNHNYDLAYAVFKDLAENPSIDHQTRANSYNMMGVIISAFAPHLDVDDDTGLKYFKNAIKLDRRNLGALLNIFDTFGTGPSMHEDVEAFKDAYNIIVDELFDKISQADINRIKEKYNLISKTD